MKILVIGSGGREHALVWALSQSDDAGANHQPPQLYGFPGSAAIHRIATRVQGVSDNSWEKLAEFAVREKIDLTLCGPEAPLATGIADLFRQKGLVFLGPSRAAAQLESSKVFAKEFMARHGIPTARFTAFEEFSAAERFLNHPVFPYPLVIKADGLAAGKGVAVCPNEAAARTFLEKIMVAHDFGAAGHRVVMEECLEGEELSFIALCDRNHFLSLPPAQDHKRLFQGDCGPNTGGMGAYSWDGLFSVEVYRAVEEKIIRPTLEGMAEEGNSYNGFLYAGIMVTARGPMVLEYNVRMGDPEAQPLLMRLHGSLAETFTRAATGNLHGATLDRNAHPAVCVVLAAEGYPEKPIQGDKITGLEEVREMEGVQIFHSGTILSPDGWETTGGRVLGITARGDSLHHACQKAYRAVDRIRFRGMQYRKDIGARGLAREDWR